MNQSACSNRLTRQFTPFENSRHRRIAEFLLAPRHNQVSGRAVADVAAGRFGITEEEELLAKSTTRESSMDAPWCARSCSQEKQVTIDNPFSPCVRPERSSAGLRFGSNRECHAAGFILARTLNCGSKETRIPHRRRSFSRLPLPRPEREHLALSSARHPFDFFFLRRRPGFQPGRQIVVRPASGRSRLSV
ncbi:hypothetical protein Pla8534_37810 [Lignipirellula cremea]|uniref:Uncharacterized protein n=1 Tax=Lignipirellula cremea TaxID=2528010 RepID=A0A518DVU7_9BACT|nr:hypothetical protein Pla8534_37810 [Lignipirellula cremea]